ncbi:MAG: hypothetical protein HRT45_02165 [Bdellovibrionales bacterium]|nr:hypothetical protein [Bdellovibrionales bacterium]
MLNELINRANSDRTDPLTSYLSIQVIYLWFFIGSIMLIVWQIWNHEFDPPNMSDPLWPITPFKALGIEFILNAVFLGIPLFAGLAFFRPYKRTLRVGFSALLLVGLAARFSNGKIDHPWHAFLLLSITLAFCPVYRPEHKLADRLNHWTLFASKFTLATIYFTAALAKFIHLTPFNPMAAVHFPLLRWAQERVEPNFFGMQMIEHPNLAFVGFLILETLLLLQILVTPFRKFQLWQGLLLILFHVSTWLVMQITFLQAMITVIVVFWAPLAIANSTSYFAKKETN